MHYVKTRRDATDYYPDRDCSPLSAVGRAAPPVSVYVGHMRFAEPPGVTARLESRKVATAATPEDKDWQRELYARMKPGQGTGTVQAVQARYHVHTTSGRSSF